MDFYPIVFKKDLNQLTWTMPAIGLSGEDIAAFVGGNAYRFWHHRFSVAKEFSSVFGKSLIS
jgi:hypothetical protein